MGKYLALFLVLGWMLTSCGEENNTPEESTSTDVQITEPAPQPEAKEQEVVPGFSVSVYSSGDGWGYDVLNDGMPYIHQPHIPAVGGNQYFKTEEDAEIAGNFVVHKLNNNILPPTVSVEELDSLGVLKH